MTTGIDGSIGCASLGGRNASIVEGVLELVEHRPAWQRDALCREYAGRVNALALYWATPPAQWIGDRSPLKHPRLHVPEPELGPALPGVRANGITSRMFETPVTNISMRSKPRPKPACGTVP